MGISYFNVKMYYSAYISVESEGAGFSEIKAILDGVPLPNFLASRTFIAKYISNALGIVGGMSVGKNGPFVHMSTIIAH
jgi:chloride channel 2